MKKVAIIRRNGLGDLILTCPLLSLIKQRGKEVEISLIVDERNFPLIPYLPKVFDKVYTFPSHGNKYINAWKLAKVLRKEKFDLALSSKTSPMKLMNYMLFCMKAKKSIAYVKKKTFLVSDPVFHDPLLEEHQALKALKLFDPTIKEIPEELYPKLQIKKSGDVSKLRLLMSASTTHSSNRIDAHKYARIVNRLFHHFDFDILLIAEKKDKMRSEEIANFLKPECLQVFPRNFDDFMIWLNQGSIFFVPDGGIAHIGAGLNKKEVIVFGNSHPKIWAPLSKEATTFYHREHVDQIEDDKIFDALYSKFQEVKRG